MVAAKRSDCILLQPDARQAAAPQTPNQISRRVFIGALVDRPYCARKFTDTLCRTKAYIQLRHTTQRATSTRKGQKVLRKTTHTGRANSHRPCMLTMAAF